MIQFPGEVECFSLKQRTVDMIVGVNFMPAVDSITDVYTVSQLKQKAQESTELFFGIMYSFVSKLDLDSSITKVIRTRWCVQNRLMLQKTVHLNYWLLLTLC